MDLTQFLVGAQSLGTSVTFVYFMRFRLPSPSEPGVIILLTSSTPASWGSDKSLTRLRRLLRMRWDTHSLTQAGAPISPHLEQAG